MHYLMSFLKLLRLNHYDRDFASDLNLTYEITTRDDVKSDPVILIIAVGSIFFIAVPYLTNLVIAAKIKKVIKNNEAAKSWFVQLIYITNTTPNNFNENFGYI